MAYDVRLSPHAVRQYKQLPPSVAPQIQAGLDALRHSPLSGAKVKRLRGRLRDYFRYRAGDYRVIYAVDTRERVVDIDYIQHRKDVYRGLS